MKNLLYLVVFTLVCCKPAKNEGAVTIYGQAVNMAYGAAVNAYGGGYYYIDGMQAWDESLNNKRVSVSGTLKLVTHELPQTEEKYHGVQGTQPVLMNARVIGTGKETYPDMDACKANVYDGKIVVPYKVYETGQAFKDTLALSLNDINAIVQIFRNESAVKAITGLKSNPIFKEMAAAYKGTYDATTLWDYAKQYKGVPGYKDYKQYRDNYGTFEYTVSRFFTDYPEVLNISFYTYLEGYGDSYFYQRGYDGFDFVRVSNPTVESVLFGWSNKKLAKYSNTHFGLEVRQTGDVITIPLVVNGEYLCDIRMMVCR